MFMFTITLSTWLIMNCKPQKINGNSVWRQDYQAGWSSGCLDSSCMTAQRGNSQTISPGISIWSLISEAVFANLIYSSDVLLHISDCIIKNCSCFPSAIQKIHGKWNENKLSFWSKTSEVHAELLHKAHIFHELFKVLWYRNIFERISSQNKFIH